MNETDILPAPDVSATLKPRTKWQNEFEAFKRLLPSLLQTHAGKYVAIHNGEVVEFGDDEVDVAMRAYQKVGYVAMHVGLVSTEAPAPARIPSPRLRSSRE